MIKLIFSYDSYMTFKKKKKRKLTPSFNFQFSSTRYLSSCFIYLLDNIVLKLSINVLNNWKCEFLLAKIFTYCGLPLIAASLSLIINFHSFISLWNENDCAFIKRVISSLNFYNTIKMYWTIYINVLIKLIVRKLII